MCTNQGTNTDTEAKRSETPGALKRKLANQATVSSKSKALFMQWISYPKNSSLRKKDKPNQPGPDEVTGKNKEESRTLNSQSQINVQACASADHSEDKITSQTESHKTAETRKPKVDNKKPSTSSCFDTQKPKHWHQKGGHMVQCEICFKNLSTVKLCVKKQLPAIVQECGAVYRTRTVENHIQTDYHKEALKYSRLRALPPEKVYEETSVGIMISSANEKLANKMGALMLQVYNDAKKLTLSAYSWPSRIVATQMASDFIFNNEQHKHQFGSTIY